MGPTLTGSGAREGADAAPADLLARAEAGNLEAQLQLGWYFYRLHKDKRGARGPNETARWFRRAAEQGNADAAWMIGWCLDTGFGVPEDAKEAFGWFSKAAEGGNTKAEISLANQFANGRGVARDAPRAAEWYRRAAERGNVDAQRALAWMLEEGDGVPKNQGLAVAWMRKAADQGDRHAQAFVGASLHFGSGVPRDYAEAERYYRLAAARGDAYATHALRRLPFDRNPILRHRYRVQTVVGGALLVLYTLGTPVSFSVRAALVGTAAYLLTGGLVALALSVSTRLRNETKQMMAHDSALRGWMVARALARVLVLAPTEDGLFLVPVLWLGFTPARVVVAAALFGAATIRGSRGVSASRRASPTVSWPCIYCRMASGQWSARTWSLTVARSHWES